MRKVFVASLVLLSVSLFGCGMFDMPDKVDQSNANMEEMKHKMDKANEGMQSTKDLLHKQTLLVALSEMLKKENSMNLYPAPTGMMPGGQAFSEEATPEELAKITFLHFREVNDGSPDPSLQVGGKWPAELATSVDHDKLVKFTAIEVIAGFAPQEKVEEIVAKEIVGGGRYQKAAFGFLALRAAFIRDILVQQGLLEYKLSDPGMIEEAVKQVEYLEYLARLPFAKKIAIKTIGMLKLEDNVELALDLDMKELWARIDRGFETDLDPSFRAANVEENRKLEALRAHVKARLAGWTN